MTHTTARIGMEGLEPATSTSPTSRSLQAELHPVVFSNLAGARRIERRPTGLESVVLPLNYTPTPNRTKFERSDRTRTCDFLVPGQVLCAKLSYAPNRWAGRDSNPHSTRRLLYRQRTSPAVKPTQTLKRSGGGEVRTFDPSLKRRLLLPAELHPRTQTRTARARVELALPH